LWAFTTILIVWAFSDGSPPSADAFSAQSLARRPLVGTNGHAKSGVGGSLQKYHQNARPFASKFYVASTGRQLNSGSEQNSVYRYNADEDEDYNEDEVPWECVIDPTGLEECIQYMIPGQGTKAQYSGAMVWRKKSQAEEDVVTFMDKVSIAAVIASSISVFGLLLKVSGPGAWRFFLAGGLCAATSHAIPTPIDVVKVSKKVPMYACTHQRNLHSSRYGYPGVQAQIVHLYPLFGSHQMRNNASYFLLFIVVFGRQRSRLIPSSSSWASSRLRKKL